ncbi:hypothetical protein GQ464_008455 [Rhodocaloribacter litoris]|uniref:hypothetical protein n=1 Tax=Rhodocaloribacter litoris TaxID=2558931 RepID=UPI001422F261|nr:hypothetical protein [Rhodocaloribacter litoris]QXD16950.1 hypothetical protein GQ464_008455 [Rhodocaloribacter litoris]
MAFLLALLMPPAGAQPLKGVVWAVPASLEQAEEDLIRMHRAGVEAVRTGLIREERLLALADTLGLQLFQELPLDYLPARLLADTLAYARRTLQAAWRRSREHPSARHFGLARRSDTSHPAACAFFRSLATALPDTAGVHLYYVSAFPDRDRCRDAVDFVLFDALDRLPPLPLGPRAGLATLGARVEAGAPPGLRNPHTPEAQARFLENHLATLLDARPAPVAVFVHRWRDAGPGEGGPEPPDPYRRRYGLHDAGGRARLAFDVVAGLYTGRQRVFALPLGRPARPEVPWLRLLGWTVLTLIGLHYAASPRFRFMIPRYFLAHTFYCEAIREGRDVLPLASGLLLLAVAASVGMTAAVVLEAYREHAAVIAWLYWLPPALREVVAGLLAQPWLVVLLAGSLYVLALSLWAALLALMARRRRALTPGQTFMMVAWPRWTFLLLMLAAMVLAGNPPDDVRAAAPLLVVAWLGLTLLALLRTLLDFAHVTRSAPGHIVAVGLANPLFVLGLPAVVLLPLLFGPWLEFFRHLLLGALTL